MNRGYIYKIVNCIDDNVYVGSTTATINKRFCNHKYGAHKGQTSWLYRHMRMVGIQHCRIEMLEEVMFDDKRQLLDAEKRWMKQIATLNKNINASSEARLSYYQNNKLQR